jgi:hypothetical protein
MDTLPTPVMNAAPVIAVGQFWLQRINENLLLLCSSETGEKMQVNEIQFEKVLRDFFIENF